MLLAKCFVKKSILQTEYFIHHTQLYIFNIGKTVMNYEFGKLIEIFVTYLFADNFAFLK